MRTALHLCLRAGRTVTCSAVFLSATAASPAADCNGNGVEDAVDLSPGAIAFAAAPFFHEVHGLTNALVGADLDGDSDADLVAGSNGGSIFVFPCQVAGGEGPRFREWPAVSGSVRSLAAADMDGDGDIDLAVVSSGMDGKLALLVNRGDSPRSLDSNRNGIPDECEDVPFRRGDANGSGAVDLMDAVFLFGHLFAGLAAPPCEKGADADDDGVLLATDAIHILGFLFRRGDPPPGPFPGCGVDPTPDGLGCELHDVCR